VKKEELTQLHAAGDQQSKGADLPPAFFRKGKETYYSKGYEKGYVGGGLDEFVIQPIRDSVVVEELKYIGKSALNRLVQGAGPKSDERQGDKHGGQGGLPNPPVG
jgi:hypothetical protein